MKDIYKAMAIASIVLLTITAILCRHQEKMREFDVRIEEARTVTIYDSLPLERETVAKQKAKRSW